MNSETDALFADIIIIIIIIVVVVVVVVVYDRNTLISV